MKKFPPISRRQFLARSLEAGAGLMFGQKLFAADREMDEHAWALLSDIHIAADRDLIARDVNMTENFLQVTGEICQLRKSPAAVLINGDLAFNSGEKGDYSRVGELLEPLRISRMTVYLTLGNHDHRERFWDAMLDDKTVSRPVVDRQVAIIRAPRVNWFVLDSLDKTKETPGVLGGSQLTWLKKSLNANRDKPAIVVVHHDPDTGGRKSALQDTEEFLEIIRPRRQVKAYIYGHTHRWHVEKDESGIHFINLPPTAYLFDKTSPNGWVLARLGKFGMRLQMNCLDPKHPEHGREVDLKWRT